MLFGVANIYSVDSYYGVQQLIRIGLAAIIVLGLIAVTSVSRNFFDNNAPLFYLAGVLSLIGVLIFGKEINGAKAWYSIGGVGVQPVELMKISLTIMLANILNRPSADIRQPKVLLICYTLLAVPAFLIMLQPDLGSLVVFGAFLLAMYREGMNPFFLILPVILGSIFLAALFTDTAPLLVGFGVLIWVIISLAILIFSTRYFSVRDMYTLIGLYLGLALFFLVYVLFSTWLYHTSSLHSILIERTDILLTITALGMGIFSMLSALVVYLAYRRYVSSSGSFASIRSGNLQQALLSGAGIVAIMLIISAITWRADDLFEKLPQHQQDRIMVLFEGEAKYRDTSGYNLLYSKTAIGSGEFWGAGWNQGTVTDGRFVPEQWTDYIFCTVGEEWGFVGSVTLILLYAFLISRIYYLAERQKTTFSRVVGYSVGSILLLHFFINIGMVLGLFPTVGIPLPFLSYGGSSLWGFTVLVFIFLKLNYENNESLV